MNKRDYNRKLDKEKRKKRFQKSERAAVRKTLPKAAQKHKVQFVDVWDDAEDAPDEIQFRDS